MAHKPVIIFIWHDTHLFGYDIHYLVTGAVPASCCGWAQLDDWSRGNHPHQRSVRRRTRVQVLLHISDLVVLDVSARAAVPCAATLVPPPVFAPHAELPSDSHCVLQGVGTSAEWEICGGSSILW